MLHEMIRRSAPALLAGALASASLPLADAGTLHVTKLTASSHTAMAITGDVKLFAPGANADVVSIVFQNGALIHLRPKSRPSQGVYAVVPPSDPLLLHGNHLCGAKATFVALAFGLNGTVTMDVYSGKALPGGPNDHCATFVYTTR